MYDKDLIAERDKKEKMVKGVIKWWNVHYTTPEELDETAGVTKVANDNYEEVVEDYMDSDDSFAHLTESLTEEQAQAANDIIARLEREAAEDEAKKQAEIAAAMAASEATFENGYNETTGSFSGAYGSGGMMDEYADQIGSILGEKDDYLKKMIEEAGE